MKVAILTMTSGEGHNHMSRVIADNLARRGIESEIIDIFKHDNFEFAFNDKGYLFACTYIPNLYNYFWKKLKFRNSKRRYHGIAQRQVEKQADVVAKLVEDAGCDFFVCVHPYTAMLCDFWRRKGKFLDKKAFAVLPDMLPHPLWESAIECDYILVPTEHCFDQLHFKGYRDEQIVVSGFPVSEKFVQKLDKQEIRQQLGFENKFTVMIVSGGNGIGKNWKVVKRLMGCDVQLLCVNGKNKKAFEKTAKVAKKKSKATVHNFGFVKNIDELMSAADVIVSRGGGGSVFEALSKGLPLIVREKSIINERENAEILDKSGAGIYLKKLKQVTSVVNDLQSHPEKLAAMQAKCWEFSQGRSVDTVCQAVVDRL